MEDKKSRSTERLPFSNFSSTCRTASQGRNSRANRFIRVKPHPINRNKSLEKSSNRSCDFNKSVDAVAMRKGVHSFGLPFYKPPNNDYLWKKTPQHGIPKSQAGRYLDKHASSLKYVPCCTKYSKIRQWNSQWMGQFRRQKRVTMSQYFIDKANKTPACNQYKTQKNFKIKGNYKSTIDKNSVFDSIIEDKKIVPAPTKYKLNHSLTMRRTHITKFQKDARKYSRMSKITKDGKPGPGSYDTQSSIEKTQWKPPPGVPIKEIKGDLTHLDSLVHNKKKIPGVGHYKDYEKAADKFHQIKT